jgi:antitoxin CptB
MMEADMVRNADETLENRRRRLKMRSMRRGIKEMDLILSAFADAHLAAMTAADLELYDRFLSENDHDLYLWVSGQSPAPAPYGDLTARIAAGAQGVVRPA